MSIAGAWCAVTEERGRLLIRWSGEGFDTIKADFRLTFPRHRDAVYSAPDRAWSLPLSQRRRLEAFVVAWFAADAIAWERPSQAEACALTPAVEAAYQALHLVPTAPPWAVDAVYRAASQRLHPDHGGQHEAMVAVNQAAAVIRQHQSERG